MKFISFYILSCAIIRLTIGSCPGQYQFCDSLCINISIGVMNYCEAWKSCSAIGGRLAIEKELPVIKTCYQYPEPYFIGLNDLMTEQGIKRTGWLFSNGDIINDTNLWAEGQPNSINHSEDCVVVAKDGLNDVSCNAKYMFICIPERIRDIRERIFRISDAYIFKENNELGCLEWKLVRTNIECGIRFDGQDCLLVLFMFI